MICTVIRPEPLKSSFSLFGRGTRREGKLVLEASVEVIGSSEKKTDGK